MNKRAYYNRPYSTNTPPLHHAQSLYYPSYNSSYEPTTPLTPYEYFAKPAQPMNWLESSAETSSNNQSFASPGVLGAFTDSNGQLDFDKMLSSIGQVASTYHQVSPIVKQLSSFVKMFR